MSNYWRAGDLCWAPFSYDPYDGVEWMQQTYAQGQSLRVAEPWLSGKRVNSKAIKLYLEVKGD